MRTLDSKFRSDLLVHPRAIQLLRLLGLEQMQGHSFAISGILPALFSGELEQDDHAGLLAYILSHSLRCDQCNNGKLEARILEKYPHPPFIFKGTAHKNSFP